MTMYHVNQFDTSLLLVFYGMLADCITVTILRRSIYATLLKAHKNNDACHNELPIATTFLQQLKFTSEHLFLLPCLNA